MEIDSDIPQFLASQKQQAPASLQNYYHTFEDLYERKYVLHLLFSFPIVSGMLHLFGYC
jgi:hypothetical protein